MANLSNDLYLPTYDDLRTPELKVSYPTLKAASSYLGKFCDFQSKEFMLCRDEYKDPRKCLDEGKELTMCGIEFYQNVKASKCYNAFKRYAHCIDRGDMNVGFSPCRALQRVVDNCMLEELNIRRPEVGYFARPHVHQSKRPKPAEKPQRDYDAEASRVLGDLPDTFELKQDFRKYAHYRPGLDFTVLL